jgi:hypothetical protein
MVANSAASELRLVSISESREEDEEEEEANEANCLRSHTIRR